MAHKPVRFTLLTNPYSGNWSILFCLKNLKVVSLKSWRLCRRGTCNKFAC